MQVSLNKSWADEGLQAVVYGNFMQSLSGGPLGGEVSMRLSTAFLILATALVLSACAPEPAVRAVDITAEEQAIRAISAEWLEFARQRDAAGIAALFAEDGRLIWSGQDPVVGPTPIQEFIANNLAANPMQTTDWSPDRVEVATSGDLAVEYGTYLDENHGPDGAEEDRGSYVTVYRKIGGNWKVAADVGASATP